jgi:hypothetical protein
MSYRCGYMKKLTLIATFLLAGLFPAVGQSPYQAGEKVSYIVHYGPINGGIASLELKRDTLAGREVYHSYFVARTTGLADALFRVKDIFECYFDPVTELPIKSIRDVHEGRYTKYNAVLFDHNARPDSAVLTSDLTGVHITQKGIYDILTCFYYFRKHFLATDYKFKKGEAVSIMTWFTDELYPIVLIYAGMDEVRTKVGKIKCYKFNPVTEVGRLFKTNDDVSFWFSADNNYLPVKVRFDIFVGAFTVDLSAYEGLVDTLDIKTRRD